MEGTLLARTTTSEVYVPGDGTIVKRSGILSGQERMLGRKEVDFYQFVRRRGLVLPVPACYAADYEGAAAGRLVLEDLRRSERRPPHRRKAKVLLIADALARVHALFWSALPVPWRDELPLAGSGEPDPAVLHARLERALAGDAREVFRGDRLTTITALIDSGICRDLARPVHRTLTHSDPHLENAYVCTRYGTADAVLIDWQLYEIGIGPNDLAHLLVFGLDSVDRRAVESAVVRRYHDRLVSLGVAGYSLHACARDYRRGAARTVLTLLAFALNGTLREDDAERAFRAYRETRNARSATG